MMEYEDSDDIHEKPVDLSIWRRLFRFTRPYRKQVIILCAAAMTIAASEIAMPVLTGKIINDVVARGFEGSFVPYILMYAGLIVVAVISVGTFIWMGGRIRTHLSHDIRRDGFGNLQQLSFSFFDRYPVGWLMSRMTSDCERLSNIMAWGVLDLVWGSTMMLGIAGVMLYANAKLALIVLAVVPFLLWTSAFFQKRILRTSRLVRKANSQLTAYYVQGIGGVRTSKVFVSEAHNLEEFGGLSTAMYRSSLRNATLSAVYLPIIVLLSSVATGFALAAGGINVLGTTMEIGDLLMFMFLTRMFFDPVQELGQWFAEMQMAQASAERIMGLIESRPEIGDSPEVIAALHENAGRSKPGVADDGGPDRIGDIEFRDVTFKYPNGEKVLENFNLSVTEGETIALVGSTGGGKTTILGLLCRFYEPSEGQIFYDGTDYKDRSLHWVQSNLGIVLQTPHLFGGTVADNIRYGKLDATDEEIREAARLVEADEFILGLKDGYDTEVGEGGVLLSTGQKQLVSFARAVIARPQILVMDEATSSVDTETEKRIQRGLARVLEGRTSFVIAHRLSTIRSADRILVIEHGQILEEGSHQELLALEGRYHKLYTQQTLRGTAA